MTATPSIVIVGLGPGDPGLRTVGTQQILDEADRIILRTRVHPGLEDLKDDPRVSDCDDLYAAAADFDELYPAIAARVIETAIESGSVVFAVPGHPRIGERSVPMVESSARGAGIPVDVRTAVSFVDAVISEAATDPLVNGMQIADAENLALAVESEPFSAGQLGIDPARGLLIGQIYNRHLASSVKIALGRLFPDDHPVLVVTAASAPDAAAAVAQVRLHELDRIAANHLTSAIVPPLPSLEAFGSADTLTRIVARLRAPGGCPWDRTQTHTSLRDSILEEAYETVDAIDAGDAAGLMEELGDLSLLVAMHAQLAEEDGTFRIEDVFAGISRKLIRRHPHVFGDVEAVTSAAVIATWEEVKAAERRSTGTPEARHPVDALPRSMPALRKVVEVFAPRTTLHGPPDDQTGQALLAATRHLIEQGIDPERALERALRSSVELPQTFSTKGSAGPAANDRGEGAA